MSIPFGEFDSSLPPVTKFFYSFPLEELSLSMFCSLKLVRGSMWVIPQWNGPARLEALLAFVNSCNVWQTLVIWLRLCYLPYKCLQYASRYSVIACSLIGLQSSCPRQSWQLMILCQISLMPKQLDALLSLVTMLLDHLLNWFYYL